MLKTTSCRSTKRLLQRCSFHRSLLLKSNDSVEVLRQQKLQKAKQHGDVGFVSSSEEEEQPKRPFYKHPIFLAAVGLATAAGVFYLYWIRQIHADKQVFTLHYLTEENVKSLRKQARTVAMNVIKNEEHNHVITTLAAALFEQIAKQPTRGDIPVEIFIVDELSPRSGNGVAKMKKQEDLRCRAEIEYCLYPTVCQLQEVTKSKLSSQEREKQQEKGGLYVEVKHCRRVPTLRRTTLHFYFPVALKLESNSAVPIQLMCLHVSMQHLTNAMLTESDIVDISKKEQQTPLFYLTEVSLCDASKVLESSKFSNQHGEDMVPANFRLVSPKYREIVIEKALAPAGLYQSTNGYTKSKFETRV